MNLLQITKILKVHYVSVFIVLIVVVLFATAQFTFAQSTQSDAEEQIYNLLVTQGMLDEQSEETVRSFASSIVIEALDEGVSLQDTQALEKYTTSIFGGGGNDVGQEGLLNNVSCFDYYSFGSVEVELQSNVVGTVSGTPVAFTGIIRNNNSYPIVDGSVYIKVFLFVEDNDNVNGPLVVDQGFVRSDITLPARGSKPIEFTWNVPSNAVSGKYMLATFFTTSKKFNLSGLSFTDDVTGKTVAFSVVGEQSGEVRFDKDNVTIDGEPYFFAAFPPRVDTQSPVVVRTRIFNSTNASVTVPVRWRLFFWDAQRREQMIEDITEQVVVPENGSVVVEHAVADAEYPVYLLEANLAYEDTKSFLNMRFVREGISRGRINFPSVTKYPLQKDEQVKIFSCLNNTSNEVIENGELSLALYDSNGKSFYEKTYKGTIISDMLAVIGDFKPKKTYKNFTLEAQLFQEGILVDTAVIPYVCEDITPGKCGQNEADQNIYDRIFGEGEALFKSNTMSVGFFGAGVAILLLIFVGIIYRRVSRKENSF